MAAKTIGRLVDLFGGHPRCVYSCVVWLSEEAENDCISLLSPNSVFSVASEHSSLVKDFRFKLSLIVDVQQENIVAALRSTRCFHQHQWNANKRNSWWPEYSG